MSWILKMPWAFYAGDFGFEGIGGFYVEGRDGVYVEDGSWGIPEVFAYCPVSKRTLKLKRL